MVEIFWVEVPIFANPKEENWTPREGKIHLKLNIKECDVASLENIPETVKKCWSDADVKSIPRFALSGQWPGLQNTEEWLIMPERTTILRNNKACMFPRANDPANIVPPQFEKISARTKMDDDNGVYFKLTKGGRPVKSCLYAAMRSDKVLCWVSYCGQLWSKEVCVGFAFFNNQIPDQPNLIQVQVPVYQSVNTLKIWLQQTCSRQQFKEVKYLEIFDGRQEVVYGKVKI